MNHQGTKTLETERLILRRFTIEDAEGFQQSEFRTCDGKGWNAERRDSATGRT